MDQRTLARLAAVQALYSQDFSDAASSDIKHLLDVNHEKRLNKKIYESILFTVENNRNEIDKIIEDNLAAGWTFDRLDKILKAILRAGIAEIKYVQADKNLVISEFVKIADSFYDGEEAKFVNALLAKIL